MRANNNIHAFTLFIAAVSATVPLAFILADPHAMLAVYSHTAMLAEVLSACAFIAYLFTNPLIPRMFTSTPQLDYDPVENVVLFAYLAVTIIIYINTKSDAFSGVTVLRIYALGLSMYFNVIRK